jgi:hypothetical protein
VDAKPLPRVSHACNAAIDVPKFSRDHAS